MLTEPRDRLIARHIVLALAHSALSMETYADAVATLYRERTPEHLRTIAFHSYQRGRDVYAVQRANAQIVRRAVEGSVRMSVEIEEALVLALPEAFRSRCLADLAGRFGLLAAEKPAAAGPGQIEQLGGMLREFGEAVESLAPVFADGVVDTRDGPVAREAARELNDLLARITTLLAMLEHVCAPAPVAAKETSACTTTVR